MKKKYLSPSVKVISIENSSMLLSASRGSSGNVDKVVIDGDGNQITDGGTTDPDTDYSPW